MMLDLSVRAPAVCPTVGTETELRRQGSARSSQKSLKWCSYNHLLARTFVVFEVPMAYVDVSLTKYYLR